MWHCIETSLEKQKQVVLSSFLSARGEFLSSQYLNVQS